MSVTTSSTTDAFVKALTSANQQLAGPSSINSSNTDAKAFAVAVAVTEETSTILLDAGSSITSTGGTVKLESSGSSNNFAWAQPGISKNGTIALAFAVGVDNATITTTVEGDIDAGGAAEGTFSAEPSDGDVDYAANTITIVNHGFVENQKVTYGVGETAFALGSVTPPAIGGLTDGDEYYIHVIDADTIQLLTAPTMDLAYTDDALLPGTPDQRIGRFDELEIIGVDVVANTVILSDRAGIRDGDRLLYLGPESVLDADDNETSEVIGGLLGGVWYEIRTPNAAIPTVVELWSPAEPELNDPAVRINLLSVGVGRQLVVGMLDPLEFDPNDAVDADADTITFDTAHGLTTGDAVMYRIEDGRTRTAAGPGLTLRDDAEAGSSTLYATSTSTFEAEGDWTSEVSSGTRGRDPARRRHDGDGDRRLDPDPCRRRHDLHVDDGRPARLRIAHRGTLRQRRPTDGDRSGDRRPRRRLGRVRRGRRCPTPSASSAVSWGPPSATPIDLTEAGDATSLPGVRGTAHTLSTSGCTAGVCITATMSAANAINGDAGISAPGSFSSTVAGTANNNGLFSTNGLLSFIQAVRTNVNKPARADGSQAIFPATRR